MKTFDQGNSFSPVFKANSGNVINMGNINANDVTLQGNKIVLEAGFDKNGNFNKITTDSLDLKGNEVYVDIGTTQTQKVNITTNKGNAYLSATGYYYNPFSYKFFDKYKNINNDFKVYEYISIGSDVDWWHFAKGWNEDNQDYKNIASEYKLTSDIDFKGNQGKGVEGKDWQNYANYWIDLNADGKKQDNEFTNMMVSAFKKVDTQNQVFNKNFDGQGFTLKNINIDTSNLKIKPHYVGIFGHTFYNYIEKQGIIKNINVDYMGGSIKAVDSYVIGGFAGAASGYLLGKGGYLSNITLNNISNINVLFYQDIDGFNIGGFAGLIAGGNVSNLFLNNIGSIYVSSYGKLENRNIIGGFSGTAAANFSNIFLNNIGKIKVNTNNAISDDNVLIGGFSGIMYDGSVSNIYVDKIKEISFNGFSDRVSIGGFVGEAYHEFLYDNIYLNNVNKINSKNYQERSDYIISDAVGGFVGMIHGGIFSNIYVNNIGEIAAETKKDYIFVGGFAGSDLIKNQGYFENISLNNIDTIKASAIKENHLGGFIGRIFIPQFTNISLNNITTMSVNNANINYIGGFFGSTENPYGNFKNIYMFFDKDSIINISNDSENYVGKFFGKLDMDNNDKPSFDNIHIYHHENDFTDIMSNINTNNFTTHIYGDDNKDEIYQDFKEKDATIARPMLPIMPQPSKPSEDLSNPNLDSILNEKPTLD
ncbi:hypothetical protein I9P32_02565, partial [Campylobacter peloridis]|nr:hypothetical protein [Campylobacter peloridis]